ncbi:MAG TPA: SLBB domain-containing protein [bacterium]|nr:SLBB domain-containing protein [bacterium]
MKLPKKTIAFFLSVFFTLFQVSPLFAQLAEPEKDLRLRQEEDLSRQKGESFGTADRKEQLPKLNQPQFPQPGQMGSEGNLFNRGLTYQVHILGEVERPGTYRIPASTRLYEALQYAGGALERGSERRVELRRGGGSRSVDLLSFKQNGNLDANPYLLDNDVIFVPLLQKVVQVAGTVKRPGNYELRQEKNLDDVVRLAGGFTPGVDSAVPIKVVRYANGDKQVLDVENTPSSRKNFQLEGADVIVVSHILTEKKKFDYNVAKLPGDQKLFYPSYDERVFVIGGVAKPGPYAFSPYYDVRQYLTLAGGTTKMGKPKKTKVVTADGKTMKAKVDTEINPGDTIVVPEKSFAPETLASLLLSAVAVVATVISVTR